MSKKNFVRGLVTFLILYCCCYIFLSSRCLNNTVDVAALLDVNIIDLDPVEYIELPSNIENEYGFAATGISYNASSNRFYIGNYGKVLKEDKDFHPSIEIMDFELKKINKEILFDESDLDIQGIAYDKTNNSIWYTNADSIINCTVTKGRTISSFKIGKYSKYKANGICIDVQNNSLWVLCMYKYLLNYEKDGTLINCYNCGHIGQDHICMDDDGNIYISVGVDYHGNDNFVICFDRNIEMKDIYRVKDCYAIEGIVVIGSQLYVVNDGIYHEAKIKKNYIQVYTLPR